MYNFIPFDFIEETSADHHLNTTMNQSSSSSSSQAIVSNDSSKHLTNNHKENVELIHTKKSNEINWRSYIPITLDKIRSITVLKNLICERINRELSHILNRLLRVENSDEHEDFLSWFFNELEYCMHSTDNNSIYCHKSLLLRSIEQDHFDCTKYLLGRNLLSSKLDINTENDQGRHCLLMLTHKNGPIDLIKYLLTHHISCLETNKIDLNKYSPFHHACRHFNLSLCEILLPYTTKQILQIENSELHTPLDYWLECLYSLKKLKPIHLQHDIDTLRLDYLLHNKDFQANIIFLQTIINRGGQLTKLPLRYIRSILPQLTFDHKLLYVDHHVNLCCILYKNRLSTLIHDFDKFKMSIQAGEILTEFIYALGTVQVEIQSRLAQNACSTKDHSLKNKEHGLLQSTMRMLYGKFFRLFECIYNNPDVDVKNFHFEHIFRRVWIYWKEPVKMFIKQSKEKNLLLKSMCRVAFFKRLNNYPYDIQNLPISSSLKQYLAYDNRFFIVQRKF
ncbi:unnamed protein product [Adineta steineri]|uniref:Ankyrin repeat protein n=1 Tax=Adineta steineri TaxID=433720 RepID=A0A815T4L2_9BILA|nr:unnamed protein product [Adineta steineri]CAF3927255.1 unnamed protein product [Adineta steineri]